MMKSKLLKTISFFCILGILLSVFPVFQAIDETVEAAKAKDKRIVVSLGDSFSSGESIEPYYGQNLSLGQKVQNEDWLAHRSQHSWPGRLTIPNIMDDETLADHHYPDEGDKCWYFAAVSGAVTDDLLGKQEKEYKKGSYKKTGKDAYKLPPQLDIFKKVGKGNADYVTITIGGNDADFAGIITDAVINGTYFFPVTLPTHLGVVWYNFYKDGGIKEDIYKAYHDIRDAAGEQAHIIVAGYPELLNSKGKGLPFNIDEATMINSSVVNFNTEIQNIVTTCRQEGMKISFVPVVDAFRQNGGGAYSEDALLNGVMFGAEDEDLKDFLVSSAASLHPNYRGAQVYADCVQEEINRLEEKRQKERVTSEERDIVLVLDVSGSMDGTPIQETKEASVKFIDTVLQEDACIGIVTYSSGAMMESDFNMDGEYLTEIVSGLSSGGGTNMDAGLQKAEEMLDQSSAKKKIIVMMSDGEPNEGRTGDALVEYANSLKEKGIILYTLGYFESLGDRSSAQSLMERLASEGYHYEISDAESLVFFFGDIADQINGQKYTYIRIACPVDVSVKYEGETLRSDLDNPSVRTSFGSLTFEDNPEPAKEGSDNRIKILRLKEGVDYDICIEGNGKGKMDYTIGFMDEEGDYSDMRKFKNIKITKDTVIDTVASNTDTTVLKVDEDGDGKYDLTYKAKRNGRGELVDYTIFIYLGLGAGGAVVLLVLVLIVRKKLKNKYKKA